MKKLIVKSGDEAVLKDDGAAAILAHNLSRIMDRHPQLKTDKQVAAKSGGEVSPRTVYNMRTASKSPTLKNIESVGKIFHLEPWELLTPGLDIDIVVKKISPEELAIHKTIEEAMKKLGVTEYRIGQKK